MIAADDPRHGKRSGYLAGCHCTPCVDANKRHCKQYRLRAMRTGNTTVDVRFLQEHVTELLEHMSMSAAAEAAGISSGHLARIIHGGSKRVHQKTAAKILAVTVDQARDNRYVPALGATRRLQALHALGYSMQRLDGMLGGYGKQNLELVARSDREWITAAWDRRIRAVFDEWCMKPPTAADKYERAGITKSLERSKRLGWVPPMAWDDIDDPAEKPHRPTTRNVIRHRNDIDEAVVYRVIRGERLDMTPAERRAVVAVLRDQRGWSENQIEQHTGISKATDTNRYPREETAA